MAGAPAAVVLHERVPPRAAPDAADVLVQADAVSQSLARLGYGCERLEVDGHLATLERELRAARPALVFNLVESLGGSGERIHAVPALLERLGLVFTGAGAEAMRITTAKLLAKDRLRAHGVATPEAWIDRPQADDASRWIVKSAWEDASHGLDDASVVRGTRAARERIAACRAKHGGEWFAERYVEGREFNVSLLAGEVMPLAEIEFRDFPAGKPRVIGYRAKWDEASFECRNTVRRFVEESSEPALSVELRSLALRCWRILGQRGYARVDFRVDEAGRPWALEVNANPCLSPAAGFAAALTQAGISFDMAVARIVADSHEVAQPIMAGTGG